MSELRFTLVWMRYEEMIRGETREDETKENDEEEEKMLKGEKKLKCVCLLSPSLCLS